MEERVIKFKDNKAESKAEVKFEMMKSGDFLMIDLVWISFKMTSESNVLPEDWRTAVTVVFNTGKEERTGYANYRCINLLSMVGKIYPVLLVERERTVTEVLNDTKHGVWIRVGVCG